jgi:hypothetical protein
MRKNKMEYDVYLGIIKQINETFGTTVEVEHSYIHEFLEGQNPIFKLILSAGDGTTPPVIIISFHLETPTVDAIQWFLRVRQLDPTLHMTQCYIKDTQGNNYVGEDAEIFKMYAIEQQVITAYLNSNKDDEEILEAAQTPPVEPPKATKTFATEKAALNEFNRVSRKKTDTFH